MKMHLVIRCAFLFCSAFLISASSFAKTTFVKTAIECEVAIVGGGAGGLHTAFRLGKIYGAKICLFEKEQELGGRIHDVALNENNADAPKVGVGARRIMEGQAVVFNLAAELGLQLETPPLGADLIVAKGKHSFDKNAFAPLYPGMPLSDDAKTDQETFLYDRLRKGPERAHLDAYPDFRHYVKALVGNAGLDYLHDMTRFRADFEYPLDARSYLDYLDEEWDVCCIASYPIGGMSAFIRGMESRALASGVRIFKSEAILSINKSAASGYELSSSQHDVHAKDLILAIPPGAFPHIKGDVIKRITQQKAFKDIIGIKVVTITQWWPEAWWKDIHNPAQTKDEAKVWRAWTTQNCINFIEIPTNPYAAMQKVTRSVYDDDARCVKHWEAIAKSTAQVEREIQAGLMEMFSQNGVSEPQAIQIPKPLKTHVQIWPWAWHYLRAGATHTNAQIADWALQPLPGEPVALVGEAYFPNRSGWSDGAYKSSLRLLNTRYNVGLAVP